MLSPRFLPGPLFYIQSIMLSPCFIPESVFYTQSVVRSPQSMFYTDWRGNRIYCVYGRNKMALVQKLNIPGFDSLHCLFFRYIRY